MSTAVAGLAVPAGMKGYRAGRPLDEVLLEAYRMNYPG